MLKQNSANLHINIVKRDIQDKNLSLIPSLNDWKNLHEWQGGQQFSRTGSIITCAIWITLIQLPTSTVCSLNHT